MRFCSHAIPFHVSSVVGAAPCLGYRRDRPAVNGGWEERNGVKQERNAFITPAQFARLSTYKHLPLQPTECAYGMHELQITELPSFFSRFILLPR